MSKKTGARALAMDGATVKNVVRVNGGSSVRGGVVKPATSVMDNKPPRPKAQIVKPQSDK